jgi:hypothetical protein
MAVTLPCDKINHSSWKDPGVIAIKLELNVHFVRSHVVHVPQKNCMKTVNCFAGTNFEDCSSNDTRVTSNPVFRKTDVFVSLKAEN